MTKFFTKSMTVNVSKITLDGWWLENTQEHVVKNTALGKEFTQNIYTPSQDSMIARYDRDTDTWSEEIKNMTFEQYWDKHGQPFIIGEPEGDYPEGAIKQAPPKFDVNTQTVLYSEETGWTVYEIQIGKAYYDEYGQELIIADYNFELPTNHTFEPPPLAVEGYAVKWVNKQWRQIIDHREKLAFAKDRDNPDVDDYIIESIGEIPNTHTLLEPEKYDSWVNDNTSWQYDIERHRPFKIAEEKNWRAIELDKVINRIDQYEKDQNYPIELRTSPIASDADFLLLLEDRKILSDYPDSENFPFGERPTLSNLAN
ncbi:hypothetical protein JKJ11_24110 [Vibrio sp. SCSIO 43133]|uniref:hypothetical protein n=1 Tax=Vibrio sp. SCSIO 43133 TaxID=2802577 RepID=UPI0020752FCB|nr:hypothetical protein [Vibrio sp. SCSIO 43133]USE02732.1 hypothetical protein JKJ11_24110 [Vibrio sp. SCSIO 43133]